MSACGPFLIPLTFSVELVGKKEALKLLLSSEVVDVEYGLKIGFFDAVMHDQVSKIALVRPSLTMLSRRI